MEYYFKVNGKSRLQTLFLLGDLFYSISHISDPDFVAVHEMEDYIYFFFRETAVEYVNCGKVNAFW